MANFLNPRMAERGWVSSLASLIRPLIPPSWSDYLPNTVTLEIRCQHKFGWGYKYFNTGDLLCNDWCCVLRGCQRVWSEIWKAMFQVPAEVSLHRRGSHPDKPEPHQALPHSRPVSLLIMRCGVNILGQVNAETQLPHSLTSSLSPCCAAGWALE